MKKGRERSPEEIESERIIAELKPQVAAWAVSDEGQAKVAEALKRAASAARKTFRPPNRRILSIYGF